MADPVIIAMIFLLVMHLLWLKLSYLQTSFPIPPPLSKTPTSAN